jgi:hypothetical protein
MEETPMLRHSIQIVLMAMLVLMQTACPKYTTHQRTDVMRVHPSDESGGSDSGAG